MYCYIAFSDRDYSGDYQTLSGDFRSGMVVGASICILILRFVALGAKVILLTLSSPSAELEISIVLLAPSFTAGEFWMD